MESFSAQKNLARVAAGWKGGNFFQKPILHPQMTFANGEGQAELDAKIGATPTPTQPIEDPWVMRRSK